MSSSSRRAFVRGQWSAGSPDTRAAPTSVEIVSLVVSARPQHLDAVAKSILAMPNAEIHARDPKGKLIVVLEAPTQGAIGDTTNQICSLPHVLSAVMVFQASDADDAIVS